MPDLQWGWVVAAAPAAAAVLRALLVTFLNFVALYSREQERRRTAERLLGKLPTLLPRSRSDDDPSSRASGQGESS